MQKFLRSGAGKAVAIAAAILLSALIFCLCQPKAQDATTGSTTSVTVTTAPTQPSLPDAGPLFSGMDGITTDKNQKPDYYTGVSAIDKRDGPVDFTVDDSKVDLSTAGTYYAIYSATDLHGNTTTYRRRIVVNHDQEDTRKLAAEIAAKLPGDAEELRDYVRTKIRYSQDWGGEDPVWFGFKHKNGNCYVHALCLESLLREKGFETRLIWVTDKSHYWNLVRIDGTWYHIDATPGTRHSKYSLMNDAQRYETLITEDGNRDWDRTNPDWPACP